MRSRVFSHGNSLDFAGIFAGTFAVGNRGVRADLCACTAVDAFLLIDMRCMVFVIESYCIARACIFAAMSKAAAAGVRDYISADRAFIAGNIHNLDNIRICFVSAHCDFDAFSEYCTFLIDAAAD